MELEKAWHVYQHMWTWQCRRAGVDRTPLHYLIRSFQEELLKLPYFQKQMHKYERRNVFLSGRAIHIVHWKGDQRGEKACPLSWLPKSLSSCLVPQLYGKLPPKPSARYCSKHNLDKLHLNFLSETGSGKVLCSEILHLDGRSIVSDPKWEYYVAHSIFQGPPKDGKSVLLEQRSGFSRKQVGKRSNS